MAYPTQDSRKSNFPFQLPLSGGSALFFFLSAEGTTGSSSSKGTACLTSVGEFRSTVLCPVFPMVGPLQSSGVSKSLSRHSLLWWRIKVSGPVWLSLSHWVWWLTRQIQNNVQTLNVQKSCRQRENTNYILVIVNAFVMFDGVLMERNTTQLTIYWCWGVFMVFYSPFIYLGNNV